MTPTITTTSLIAAVRAFAAAKPDHIYPLLADDTCANHKDTLGSGPGHGCIIGQALRACGVPESALANSMSLESLITKDGLIILQGPEEDIEWLCQVQFAQDQQTTWGTAVVNADREHGPRPACDS